LELFKRPGNPFTFAAQAKLAAWSRIGQEFNDFVSIQEARSQTGILLYKKAVT